MNWSIHTNYEISNTLEWIPYNRFDNVKYIAKDKYRANWRDGCIDEWDYINKGWRRKNQMMYVTLKSINYQSNYMSEYINKIVINRECYGITQDPDTKNYMVDTNEICEKYTQLSTHVNMSKVLEWIPYNKFYNIKYVTQNEFGKMYRANWIDGYIDKWDNKNQNWKRKDQNIFVVLKSLNNYKNFIMEFINKISVSHKIYGITQDLVTNNYMITSGNNYVDKFIQDTQLSVHDNIPKVLEWIPYNKFYDIGCFTQNELSKMYRANWIDGRIDRWDYKIRNWKRADRNMFVILKSFYNPINIMPRFINELIIDIKGHHKIYGITQDVKTRDYMVVLNVICENYNYVCNAIHFQRNFKNWTSSNNLVDKFIQNSQIIAHKSMYDVLEWITYSKFHDIKYITKSEFGNVYGANRIDGCLDKWDNECQNWKRKNQNMFVVLRSINNSINVTPEFIKKITKYHKFYGITQDPAKNIMRKRQNWQRDGQNMFVMLKFSNNITLNLINKIKIHNKVYGITQDPKTKNHMVVITCKECNYICNSMFFQQNFKNWTSGNHDIDRFIQNTQLSVHKSCEISSALEWIPYKRLCEIKYVKKKFGTICSANWIDGYIDKWDNESQNWKRKEQNIFVILKSINNPKNILLEFNGVKVNHNVYGITQNPETKNYIMVLNGICVKCNNIFIRLLCNKIIPYNRLYNVKYIAKDKFANIYRANWIDGRIGHIWDQDSWDNENKTGKEKIKICL
ncbi:kinase-like domain-containing protein [Rhizophagus clarus]|uniref:Kinase-like domain-containing protein n=1 Tax=Rhizophagus clarus TaxID=94130 RepID=A0A8H3LLG5_9GLOM|nr:kinase-like domain-containing protein [Rhizophagus clarus]